MPRLELCGRLLLARLCHKIISALKFRIDKVVLWTNSQIALTWINDSPSRWSTFVAKRVTEIQEITSSWQWGHVQTTSNPTDLVSRGMDGIAIIDSYLWWEGQDFLKFKDINIHNHTSLTETTPLPEVKKITHLQTDPRDESLFLRFSRFHRYSDLSPVV